MQIYPEMSVQRKFLSFTKSKALNAPSPNPCPAIIVCPEIPYAAYT